MSSLIRSNLSKDAKTGGPTAISRLESAVCSAVERVKRDRKSLMILARVCADSLFRSAWSDGPIWVQ